MRTAHRSRRDRVETRLDVRPMLVFILLAAGLALFYLSQSTRVAATGYEIDSLEAVLAERLADQHQLVLAIGEARSPAEITRRARAELGLAPLDVSAISFVPGTDAIPLWTAIDD